MLESVGAEPAALKSSTSSRTGRGYKCQSCSAMAVDGVAVWLFERTGETKKWEEALNKLKAAIIEKGRQHPS